MSDEREIRYYQPVRTSGYAIGSFIFSFAGYCSILFGIVAVIFGHVAIGKIGRSDGALKGKLLARFGLVIGYIGLAFQAAITGIFVYAMFHADGEKAAEKREEARALFSIENNKIPAFPNLPELQPIPSSDVRVAQLSLKGPGVVMSLRIYVPPGEHPDGSLSCVLTAPAGTNLMSGSNLEPLTDASYHDESLPYAEAGMVVVMYSIDGEMNEDVSGEEAQADEMKRAYLAFKAAAAGVANGRNALEFALERLPMVNRERIYSAGHSSAATLSLLMAAHESRLAGSLAYAPVVDIEKHFSELLEQPLIGMVLPDIERFVIQSSPKTHVAKLSGPLFLFFAEDDRMASADDAWILVSEFPSRDNLTYRTVPEGGHYQSMITNGISEGITWIRSQEKESNEEVLSKPSE